MATPEPSTTASVPDRSPDPGQPSPGQAAGSEAYRDQAGRYDRRTDAFRRWRELVVSHLPAQSGDTEKPADRESQRHAVPATSG